MTGSAANASTLLAIARRLAEQARIPMPSALPSLLYLSDSVRSPDPVRVARTLPAGCGVVLRHYDHHDRRKLARTVAAVCRERGLTFLVAADPALAADVGADGVHWPEALLAQQSPSATGIVTTAAHGLAGLQAAAFHRCDVAILSPLFATASHRDAAPLGLDRFRALVVQARIPVLALGGITATNAGTLEGCGAAGIAAIGAFEL